jgi:hypothetical protein
MSRPCNRCRTPKPPGAGRRYWRRQPTDGRGGRPARQVPASPRALQGLRPAEARRDGLHYCHACRPISSQLERPTHCVGCGQRFTSTRRGVGWSRFCTRECAYATRRRISKIDEVWVPAIEEHLLYLRAGGRRQETLRLRRHYLGRLAATVQPTGPWDVTKAQIIEYLTALGSGDVEERPERDPHVLPVGRG